MTDFELDLCTDFQFVQHKGISTITATASSDYVDNKIDFEMFSDFIKDNNSASEFTLKPCTSKKNKTQTNIRQFKHQMNVKKTYENVNKGTKNGVNVKVFVNGELHITGCNSLQMIRNCVTDICNELNRSNSTFRLYNVESTLKTISIRMINVPFNINMKINQNNLGNILDQKYNIYSTFNPKNYSGIIIKIPNNDGQYITLLVFHSGKGILSGAKTIEDINMTLRLYDDIVKDHGDNFKSKI